MKDNFWKKYNLSIVLAILFLLSWLGQAVFQWQEYVQNSLEHNQEPNVEQFTPVFLSRTLETGNPSFCS